MPDGHRREASGSTFAPLAFEMNDWISVIVRPVNYELVKCDYAAIMIITIIIVVTSCVAVYVCLTIDQRYFRNPLIDCLLF